MSAERAEPNLVHGGIPLDDKAVRCFIDVQACTSSSTVGDLIKQSYAAVEP